MFKKYKFAGERGAYKGTCRRCGLVKGWYEFKNYKLIETITK